VNRLTIYSGPLSMFGAKVEIAAGEKGVEFDLVMVPFDFARGYAPKHPEVLRVNPKHQVPVLVDSDVEIFDSTQVFEYLEDRFPAPPLWPRSIAARAEARKLELCSDEVFFPHVIRLMGLRGNPDPVDAPEWKTARAEIERHYGSMNQLLRDREYLADRFSYVLHGAILCGASHRTDDCGALESARMARAHDGSAGSSDGRHGHGGLSPQRRPSSPGAWWQNRLTSAQVRQLDHLLLGVRRRFEQLHQVSGRIFEQDLAAAGTGHDLVAKRGPCPSQNVDLAVEVAGAHDDSIPSPRLGSSAIGHRLRSSSRPLGRAQHELHVFALQKCEIWTRLTSDPESQVLLVEHDRLVDVVYDVSDHKCA